MTPKEWNKLQAIERRLASIDKTLQGILYLVKYYIELKNGRKIDLEELKKG